MRSRLREILQIEVAWGNRPLRWSPTKARHYDEGLGRYHTEVEEEQLQRDHELRCRSKELYKKGVVTFRYLRAHQCKIRRFLDRVAKNWGWIDRVHRACLRKWGRNPPEAGGSEDYSDEILDLPTPEWLNVEEGEKAPTTPYSASQQGEEDDDIRLVSSVPATTEETGEQAPTSFCSGETAAAMDLGAQAPVTPEWPEGRLPPRRPLPGSVGQSRNT